MAMKRSAIVRYYEQIKILCEKTGLYLRDRYLLDDLLMVHGVDPSPESYKTLCAYYGGKLAALRENVEDRKKDQEEAGRVLSSIMNAYGIYDKADAKAWCGLLEQRNEIKNNTDFRAKVVDWCNAELKKIGKSEAGDDEAVFIPLTCGDFIGRWNKLLDQRKERRKKRKSS